MNTEHVLELVSQKSLASELITHVLLLQLELGLGNEDKSGQGSSEQ